MIAFLGGALFGAAAWVAVNALLRGWADEWDRIEREDRERDDATVYFEASPR